MTTGKSARHTNAPAAPQGGPQTATLSRPEYNYYVDRLRAVIMGSGLLNGYEIPRYELCSIIARRIPFFAYDNPLLEQFCSTAFTTFNHIFFSASFLQQLIDWDKEVAASGQLKQGEVPGNAIFVTLHELMHIAMRHDSRLFHYDRDVANIAGDLSINTKLQRAFPQLVLHEKLKAMALGFKPGDIEKYSERDEEGIAEELSKDKQLMQQLMKQLLDKLSKGQKGQTQPGQKGRGQPSPDGDPSSESDAESDGEPNAESGSRPSKGAGKPEKGNGPAHRDNNHIVSEEELREAVAGTDLEYILDKLGAAKTDEEREAVRQDMERKLISDIQNMEAIQRECGGKLPGSHITDHAREIIEDLQNPRLKWRLGLREMILGDGLNIQMHDEVPGDLYYVDPTDMGLGSPVYLDSPVLAKPDRCVVVIIDTSGSVDHGQLRTFYSEVFGIVDAEGDQASEIIVLPADTVIRGEPEILDLDAIQAKARTAEALGRGGTDFATVMRQAMALEILESRKKILAGVVYFTDLLDNPPNPADLPEDTPPICFVTTPSAHTAEFARRVRDWAKVYEIRDGVEIDLEDAPRVGNPLAGVI